MSQDLMAKLPHLTSFVDYLADLIEANNGMPIGTRSVNCQTSQDALPLPRDLLMEDLRVLAEDHAKTDRWVEFKNNGEYLGGERWAALASAAGEIHGVGGYFSSARLMVRWQVFTSEHGEFVSAQVHPTRILTQKAS